MNTIRVMLALSILAVCVACGGKPTTTNNSGGSNLPAGNGNSSSPLDPQGNWQFNLQGPNPSTSGTELSVSGQLFELSPPTVNASSLYSEYPCSSTSNNNFWYDAPFSADGAASGTNSISLTFTQTKSNNGVFAVYTLTGTIAPDQQSMSGTWTSTNTNGCTGDTNGPWTASLIKAVTGTWNSQVGTIRNGNPTYPISSDVSVFATLTENTDQTSANMGQVTGSFSIPDCATDPLTLTNISLSDNR